MCVYSLSRARLFVTLWTVPHQAPLSMGFLSTGFSWKEYCNELSFSPPGDLPQPSCISFITSGFFTPETLRKCQPANIIGDIALHFNRFVTHFTQIIHNKHKINQTFSILRDSTLKTIALQHTPQTGAGFSEQARRVTDWGRGGWELVGLKDYQQ